MQKFEYRSPRFATNLPLKYVDSGGEIAGTCTQISPDGMEVHLVGATPAARHGTISLTYNERTVELGVTVAHVKQDRCGLRFVYKSEREAKTMKDLIAALAAR